MKAHGGVEVQIQLYWPQHQTKVNGQLHAPAVLSPGKKPPVPIG
jgi:hypothetical protein